MSNIIDKLDAEIKALEEAQFTPPVAEGTPAESITVDPSASFTIEDTPFQSEPVSLPAEEDIVEAQSIPVDNQVGETTKQKRVSWKNRYTKLKAHHDAARYEDRQMISEAYNKITVLERENISLRSEVGRLNIVVEPSVRDLATPEEINVIGDEGISSIDKLTKRAVDTAVKPLQEQLAKAEEDRIASMEKTSLDAKQEAYNLFLNRLEEAVPNFAELDEDPRFEKYLLDPDPQSGIHRMAHFKQAESSGDVGRVAYYLKGFEATIHKPSPLESKITPVGIGATPTQVNTQPVGDVKYYRIEEYSKFMDDLTKGRKYKGRQQEADAQEAIYDKAFLEGRMVG